MALSAAYKARARTVLWGSVAYIALAALACAFAACESSTSGGGPGPAGTGFGNGKDAAIGTQPSEGDSSTIGNLFNDAGLAPEDGGVFADAFTIPENFVPTELGGYALGPPVNGDGSDAGFVQSGNTNCSLVVGVVRDFLSFHMPAPRTAETPTSKRSRGEARRSGSCKEDGDRDRPGSPSTTTSAT